MDRHSKIKKAYKDSVEIYDDILTHSKWQTKLFFNIFWGYNNIRLMDSVLSYIPDNFSGTLLDVPVGTAVSTWKKYRDCPKANISCVDYSEEMLLRAQKRFNEMGLKNIECIQGDVGDLPFEDQSFDIVLSMHGFHAFPDNDKAFDEITRVLKKRGLFVGCFYIKKEKMTTDFLVNFIHTKKGWFTPPFYTKSEIIRKLKTRYTDLEIDNEKAIVWFKCKRL